MIATWTGEIKEFRSSNLLILCMPGIRRRRCLINDLHGFQRMRERFAMLVEKTGSTPRRHPWTGRVISNQRNGGYMPGKGSFAQINTGHGPANMITAAIIKIGHR